MRCDEAEVALATHAMGELSQSDAGRLQEHLGGCEGCRRAGAEFVVTAHRLGVALDPVDPPARLRTSLMATVYGEARAHGGARKQGRRARMAEAVAEIWNRVPMGRGWTAAGVAGIAAAVAVAGLTVRGPAPSGAPSLHTIALAGTPRMPSAHGVFTYDASKKEAVITLTGMGTTPASGAVYEVVMMRPDHTAQTVANLAEQPDGTTWSAAVPLDSMSGYTTVMAITPPPRGAADPRDTAIAEGSVSS